MVKAMTLRLPSELDKKLQRAIRKGNAVTKTELIRRAIDEFIENHPEMFA
jgi:predicted transcriptional regulator